jgi:hypothetical protein
MDIEEASEVWNAYTENVNSIKDGETIDHIHLINNIWTFRTTPIKHLCVVMVFESNGFNRHLRLTKLSETEIQSYKNEDTKWIHTVE